jgi:hypothetical protein
MPMQVIRSGLWLCSDCAMWAVNGDVSGVAGGEDRVEAIKKGVAALGCPIVAGGAVRSWEECRRYCNACRTSHEGKHYEFVVFGNVEAKPVSKRWVHVSGSSWADDGVWARGTDDPNVIEVYEFAYWHDLDSSAGPEYGKYNCVSGTVDLTSHHLYSALRSSGWELDTAGNLVCDYDGSIVSHVTDPTHTYCLAECLWRHGAHEVHTDVSGNNRRAVIRQAKRAL